jgi:hypothetical protein
MNHCLSQILDGAKMDEAMQERMKNCINNQAPSQEGGSDKSQDDHESHK